MRRYLIVGTLLKGALPTPEPLDDANARIVEYKDQVFASGFKRERDPRMLKKDVRQHELDRGSYAVRRRG